MIDIMSFLFTNLYEQVIEFIIRFQVNMQPAPSSIITICKLQTN